MYFFQISLEKPEKNHFDDYDERSMLRSGKFPSHRILYPYNVTWYTTLLLMTIYLWMKMHQEVYFYKSYIGYW